MLNFSFHENFEYENALNSLEIKSENSKKDIAKTAEEVYLFSDKITMPKPKQKISRIRLNDYLAKTSRQIGTTFIVGRAGTGKTALAADYAKNYRRAGWFTVETAEMNWNLFSRYLTASFNEPRLKFEDLQSEYPETFVENLFSRLAVINYQNPFLLVLDDVHNVFDAEWFNDFFNALVYSLTPRIHLLLLARSSPSFPIWRLRSKQVVGVLDEKLLAFTEDETKELFTEFGCEDAANPAWRETFGRISKLKQVIAGQTKKPMNL